MSQVCQLTGKKPQTGHNVSHSNRKTLRRYNPNLVTKKVVNPLTGKTVRLKISTRALRTLAKNPGKFSAQIAKLTAKYLSFTNFQVVGLIFPYNKELNRQSKVQK